MRAIACLIPLLLCAGCGGKSLYTVKGKVVYVEDGSPFAGGWVYFENTDPNAKASADSPIAKDGTFEMRTSQPKDGVAPGTYRVMVKPPQQTPAKGQILEPLIDPKYLRPETSGIELIVEAKANFFEIKVSKP